MTHTKHTPRPWKILREPDTDLEPGIVRVADSEGRRHVARVYGWRMDSDDPEVQANARLIAAAPDLLAALEGAFDLMTTEDMPRGVRDYAFGTVRAAIRRAKGEE